MKFASNLVDCNLILCALILFSPVIVSGQIESSWIDGSGNWSNANNWSNGTPDGWFNASIGGDAQNIHQDMNGLQVNGLGINANSVNLVLDAPITIADSFEFFAGNISGNSNLTVAARASAILRSPAVFSGNGANGGGIFQIQGLANIQDSFTSNGFLELSGNSAALSGGDLILNNSFTWGGGVMSGPGTTYLNQGALISNGKLNRSVESHAGIILTDAGLDGISFNAVWNNVGPNAIFKISADQSVTGTGTFHNQAGAFLKKSGGTGTSIVEWDVIHEGNMIAVESGEFSFRGQTYLNGQLFVLPDAVLDLKGNAVFGPDVSHGDFGTLKISGGTARFDNLYHGHLDTILSGSSFLFGTGDIHFHRNLEIRTSLISGTGTLNLHGDSQISIADVSRVTNNYGTANLTNGVLSSLNGSFNNYGIVELDGFNNAITGNGNFTNLNGGIVNVHQGNAWFDWSVENSGFIEINNLANISFRNNFNQTSTGELQLHQSIAEFRGDVAMIDGLLAGNGTLDSTDTELIVTGTVEPGPGIDSFLIDGDIQFSETTIFNFDISSDSSSDFIAINGDLLLDGQLNIGTLGLVGRGSYDLFSYTGDLQNNGLGLTLPGNLSGNLFFDIGNQRIGLNVTSIPEPNLTFAIAGAVGLIVARRRRRFE